jgi:preprotein translocase subunit SecD
MTGEVIADASIAYDRRAGNRPIVQIKFDKRGGVLFEKISGDNVGRYLAIILDDVVYSAPVIKTKISGGEAVIEGNFSIEDAKELVIVLRAGALPATISVFEERTVGPSLGSASIRSGIIATLIGLAAVVLFMALYYGASGLVADSVLILNFIIILGVMSLFQATLIYERVREELRLGKTPRAALDAGYAKAFLTIMDSNITTLIAALVLFQFGTGPVKGFAVTLSVGIMTSLFTAVFVSHAIFDFFMSRFRIKKLSV